MPDREAIKQFVRDALEERFNPPNALAAAQPPVSLDETVKHVITEFDLRDIPEGGRLLIREDAIITPSALDMIRERRIEVERRVKRTGSGKHRLIAIGADHGGFEMKEKLKSLLDELGYRYRDFGTYSADAVDYPDVAHAVARAVADGVCDLGVMIDGAGIGVIFLQPVCFSQSVEALPKPLIVGAKLFCKLNRPRKGFDGFGIAALLERI